jgi:hypothetical protein
MEARIFGGLVFRQHPIHRSDQKMKLIGDNFGEDLKTR